MAREIDARLISIYEHVDGGIEVLIGSNRCSCVRGEKGVEAVRSCCKVKIVAAGAAARFLAERELRI